MMSSLTTIYSPTPISFLFIPISRPRASPISMRPRAGSISIIRRSRMTTVAIAVVARHVCKKKVRSKWVNCQNTRYKIKSNSYRSAKFDQIFQNKKCQNSRFLSLNLWYLVKFLLFLLTQAICANFSKRINKLINNFYIF